MILVHPFKEPSNPDRKEIVSRGLRYFAILLIFLVAITGYLENTMISELKLKLEHFCENQTTLGLLLTGVVYTLLLAIPFVPGIE
ncbi:MAG: hypothetical protein OEX00_10540, partial [Gammaproteobacteria bacterium]|nr:hypothetical protein [Gammaproteobacteria bacterium]